MSLTKRELAIRIAAETGLTQLVTQDVIQRALDYIVESLEKGTSVEFRNFGVFVVKSRRQRIGRNPRKPDRIVAIPARKVVRFKPGLIMRRKISRS